MPLEPWTKVKCIGVKNNCQIDVLNRSYKIFDHYLPTSIISNGVELLSSPIKVSGFSNNKPINFIESTSLMLEQLDEDSGCIVSGAQSDCLIVNTAFNVEYDGTATVDVTISPRSLFFTDTYNGINKTIDKINIQKIYLDVPLRKDVVKFYYAYTFMQDPIKDGNGNVVGHSGRIPSSGLNMPFRPSVFLGNDEVGLSVAIESSKGWQIKDEDKCIQVLDGGDCWILRYNLIEDNPKAWLKDKLSNCEPTIWSPALTYRFYITATPSKPINRIFDKDHLAQFCDFDIGGITTFYNLLTSSRSEKDKEIVFDRINRANVKYLVLHESWNNVQNYWRLDLETIESTKNIVELAHKNGIKVLVYFGFEIGTMQSDFKENYVNAWMVRENTYHVDWYRRPYQRAMPVCYNTPRRDDLIQGIARTMDRFKLDGVYLDGTASVRACYNTNHGCGFYDDNGKLHPTYALEAYRKTLQGIYKVVHERNGIINLHTGGAIIPMVTAFCDSIWSGEHIQDKLAKDGISNVDLEGFRFEYAGVNIGSCVHFIVYEKNDWTFEKSLALTAINGIYPRPNDQGIILDKIDKIWQITDAFDIVNNKFIGYWNNQLITSENKDLKISYYVDNDNKNYLIYISNLTKNNITSSIKFIDRKAINITVEFGDKYDGELVSLKPESIIILKAQLK